MAESRIEVVVPKHYYKVLRLNDLHFDRQEMEQFLDAGGVIISALACGDWTEYVLRIPCDAKA